jgi:predicted ArsR family transcriptional regulator
MATGVDAGKRHMTMLAVAVTHPVRTRCFAILAERTASPVEIARELRLDVNQVSYHIRQLDEWGLIEEVDNRPVRGAVEHFYRAVVFPEITAEEEATLFPEERRQHAETVLSLFTADAVRSLDTGLLYERTDHYLDRYAYDVDEKAWEESREAYAECFAKIQTIKEGADRRLEEGEDADSRFRMLSFLGMFEIPPLRR